MNEIATWSSGLDIQFKTAALGAATSVFVAIIGVLAIVWQIGRQARHAIAQNRQNESIKLKLQIYEEISSTCLDEGAADAEFVSLVNQFETEILFCHFAVNDGREYAVPRSRVLPLIDAHQETWKQALRIIMLTERWHIIDPRIDVFRLAVNAALHDIGQAFTPYYEVAIKTMPQEALSGPLQGQLLPWQPPDREALDRIKTIGGTLKTAILGLGNYVYDFQIEMQNALLGELFRSRVPPRAPLDPKLVVVELSKHRELADYFNNKTAWGIEGTRIANEQKALLREP